MSDQPAIPFRLFTHADCWELTRTRKGEVKLGERVEVPDGVRLEQTLAVAKATCVLLGIPEDVGVRANRGVGGAHTGWLPSLRALLNMQSNHTFSGESLLVLGAFDTSDIMQRAKTADEDGLRMLTSELDAAVAPVIEAIARAGKTPIVVGGGHNNALPIISGIAAALGQPLSCINFDAHSDYRVLEGRHSGNGFRYAMEAGVLNRYAILGLQEEYTPTAIFDSMSSEERVAYWSLNDLSSLGAIGFEGGLDASLKHMKNMPFGAELDLDAIAGTLASATSPVGFTITQARRYVSKMATAGARYLHLTEGATELADGRQDPLTGKLLAYLIRDFTVARTQSA